MDITLGVSLVYRAKDSSRSQPVDVVVAVSAFVVVYAVVVVGVVATIGVRALLLWMLAACVGVGMCVRGRGRGP